MNVAIYNDEERCNILIYFNLNIILRLISNVDLCCTFASLFMSKVHATRLRAYICKSLQKWHLLRSKDLIALKVVSLVPCGIVMTD